jgi:Flp pilus assembly protein TadG
MKNTNAERVAAKSIFRTQPRMRLKSAQCEKGVIAILIALLLPIIIGFGAFAVDFSYRFLVRSELQNAADATALAAASCLFGRANCGNLNATKPDWNTARQSAIDYVSKNSSENTPLTNVAVDYGYWNITGTPAGLQSLPKTPATNDLAAVKITISKDIGANGGPVKTFLAPILGIYSKSLSATAVAVVPYPTSSGIGTVFPVAITKCLYDDYCDSANKKPKIANAKNIEGFDLPQTVGEPYLFKVTSSLHTCGCEAGQWSSLDTDSNSTTTIRGLISNGNSTDIPVGGKIWIQPGTKTALYSDVNNCSAAGNKSCEYVTVPIVQDISTHSYNSVIAYACMRILSATGGSEKYITMQMSNDADKCQAKGSGGGGTYYGELVPPRLAL